MQIHTLKLKNFRNYTNSDFTFDGKSKLIRGENGSGKSNILEAIHLLSTTKSATANYDHEMITHNKEVAYVSAEVTTNGDAVLLEMSIKNAQRTTQKLVKINGVKKQQKDFAGTFTSVLFTPEDINILTGSPSLRRRYIDMLFFQLDPKYKQVHLNYAKTLKQRNRLLETIRDHGKGRDQLEFWNDKLSLFGNELQLKRGDFFAFITDKIDIFGHSLNSAPTSYEVIYKPNKITKNMLAEFEAREIAAKSTLLGPQRDDFGITQDGHDLAAYGSRGQQRTAILALKLCEIDYLFTKKQHRPVLLLDDIFSELDNAHRSAIDDIVGLQQTIITTAYDSTNEITLENI